MIHKIIYFYVIAFIKAVTFIMVIAFNILPAVPPSPSASSCSLCYNSFISFTSLIIITFSFCLCKFFTEFRILVVKYITVYYLLSTSPVDNNLHYYTLLYPGLPELFGKGPNRCFTNLQNYS